MIDIKTINELGQIIRGVTYKPSDASTKFIEGYVPVLRAGNIKNGRIVFGDFVYVKPERVKDVQRIQKGDVVIAASTGSKKVIGKAAQIKENWDGSFGGFCIAFRPDTNLIDPKYFGYFFQSKFYRKMISHMSSGANINNLKKDHFDRLKIPLPTLEEQKRIVRILDQADSLRQKRQKSISLLDDNLKAVFLEMFGDPVTNPKGWGKQKFSKICTKILGGGTPSKSNSDFYVGNIPWVTPKDMKMRFIYDSKDHITDEAVSNSATKIIPSKSVLMVIRSGILKHTLPVAINEVEVTVNQDMKAYIIDPRFSNPYFVLFFFEVYQHHLLKKVRSVTADNIKFDDIKNILMILPPIELQNKFEDIAKKSESTKQKMLNQSNELDKQFQALMQKTFKL